MPQILFIEYDGTEHRVDTDAGRTIMQAATDNLVPGIDADCGGECSCATCHVFVDPAWLATIGGPGPQEATMLDLAPERQDTSRLGCQIEITDAMDGLVVRLPQFQM